MSIENDRPILRAGDVSLTIDTTVGGRIASLVVAGHELLVTDGAGPIWWGCYPMAPFAGRIGDGRFSYDGRPFALPLNLPPHAIHGTVFDRAWQVTSLDADRAAMATDLGPDWPFRGRVSQDIALSPDRLQATLTLEADEPMPAWLGWHPWFAREVAGVPVELDVRATSMYVRGLDGLPTGELAPPGPHPWDDAFTGVVAPPRVSWPGVLTLELASTAAVWIVFDGHPAGICVEPQTAPPDAVNLAAAEGREPAIAAPGQPMSVSMTWLWSREQARPA